MRINFFVEDMLFFKYIGCATVAKTLYRELGKMDDVEVSWKGYGSPADLVHFHTFGPFAATKRRVTKGRKVLTAHSTPRINEGNIALAKVINRYYPKIYRRYDHIITISPSCHEEVQRMVPDKPMTMIPNGINRDHFCFGEEKRQAFREEYGIGEDDQVVLTVAQLTPRKGLYDFLTLAARCPEKRWVWVGGLPYGAMSKNYRRIKRIKRHPAENVIFTGHIPDISDAYSGADVFLLPSYAETFGLVILEALSCGLPVIARDIPEYYGIFDDQILFFEDNDEVVGLLDETSLLRQKAASAREFSARYDIRSIAAQHLALYRELLES
ncbi:MAG: glycosyltransferase family 4 protein [Methanoregulaceae archaeon]|nr:glycosyltransferase family 4 protein [Methanoregulaceae archaeon]